jgi:hypothetical protein
VIISQLSKYFPYFQIHHKSFKGTIRSHFLTIISHTFIVLPLSLKINFKPIFPFVSSYSSVVVLSYLYTSFIYTPFYPFKPTFLLISSVLPWELYLLELNPQSLPFWAVGYRDYKIKRTWFVPTNTYFWISTGAPGKYIY